MGWGGGGSAAGGELGPWEQQLHSLQKASARMEGVVASPRPLTPRAGTPRAGTPRSRVRHQRQTDPLVAVLASI